MTVEPISRAFVQTTSLTLSSSPFPDPSPLASSLLQAVFQSDEYRLPVRHGGSEKPGAQTARESKTSLRHKSHRNLPLSPLAGRSVSVLDLSAVDMSAFSPVRLS